MRKAMAKKAPAASSPKTVRARRAAPAASPAGGARHRLTDVQLLDVYRAMLRLRTLDERMITLQRQGRVGFYGACTGQEAATIGSGYALEKRDWIFPGLREAGIMLLRGFPLVPYISQVFGNEADVTKGRQMPSHQASREVNQVSWGSVIGTQIPQAVGAAYAAKYKGDDVVAVAYFGDGATSSADFHTGMNFAAVFKVPCVLICQNNHWSISMPRKQQTASESIAVKAVAYGMPGVKVDGNDVEAVYAAVKAAVEAAREGRGPSLLELETYRIGAHSTSDDPTKYRDPAEVEAWRRRDPIDRCRARLSERGVWSGEQDEALKAELLEEVNGAIKAAEAYGEPAKETLFQDVYADEPWNLAEQRAEYLALRGGERSARGGG